MLNFVDVVILTQKVCRKNMFLTRTTFKNYDSLLKRPSIQLFSDEVILYLNALSKEIYKDSRVKYFPDVVTFSFFCYTVY